MISFSLQTCWLFMLVLQIPNTVDGQAKCLHNAALNGPEDTCVEEGQEAKLSCKVGTEQITWQLQEPGEDKSKLLGQNEKFFILEEYHTAAFTPVNMLGETFRHWVLTVSPVEKSMDGSQYWCMYGGNSSCATLSIAKLEVKKNMTVTSSCAVEKDKLIVRVTVSDYTATPGLKLKLTSDKDVQFQSVRNYSGVCQEEEKISGEWQVEAADLAEQTLLLNLQYQHQSTGDTLHEVTDFTCEVPGKASGLGTGPILGIVIGILLFLLIVVSIVYIVTKKTLSHPSKPDEPQQLEKVPLDENKQPPSDEVVT